MVDPIFSSAMQCPRCGLVNPPWIQACQRCGLPAGPVPQQQQYAPQQYAPQQRVDHRRPARTEVILGVTAWRLVIVMFAVIGLMAGIDENGDGALKALSQSASLLAALVYGGLLLYPFVTGMRWHEPRTAWWRGATTVTLLLVAGVFLTMLSGDVSETWSLFEHLLTPLILLADWIFVGRNQANIRGWTPLTWLCFPTIYLLYYNAAGLEIYEDDFSLRFDNSDFMSYFPGFVAGLIAAGYLLFLTGRIKASVSAQQEAQKQQPMYAGGPAPPPYGSAPPYS